MGLLSSLTAEISLFSKTVKREGSAIYVLKQPAVQQNTDLLFKAKQSLVIIIQKTKVNIVG